MSVDRTVWIAESHEQYESSHLLGIAGTETVAKQLAQDDADANIGAVVEYEAARVEADDVEERPVPEAAEPLQWETAVWPRHRDLDGAPGSDRPDQVAYPRGDRYYTVRLAQLHG